MDLREIGAMLREERERQNLSLDEVSDKIKITRTCLAAIEEGNESLLPHPVYAKGFIKNYAKLLGVYQETFRQDLAEVYKHEDTPLQEVPLLQDLPDDDCGCQIKSGPRLKIGAIVLALLLVGALAGLGWYGYTRFVAKSADNAASDTDSAKDISSKAQPVTPTAPAEDTTRQELPATVPTVPPATPSFEEPLAPAPTAPAVSEPEPLKSQAQLPGTAPVASQPAPTPEDRATQEIATSGPATSTTPAVPAAPATVSPAETATAKAFTVGEQGNHLVTITAHDRCWLQAGADGGPMAERMLEKGDVFTGRFAEYLLVRLGNAGAVEIRFDNKLYPLQATKGSVKTLKFVAKKTGAETPATGTNSASTTPPPAAPAPAASQPQAAAPAEGGNTAENAAKEVEIYGQDGSWVSVNPDKGPAKDVYVKKGQRVNIPFGEKLEIKLGNPSSVVFRYNGKETPVTTERGESKTVRFP